MGRIGRAHGIRGDVAVDLHTDEPERRFEPGQVLRIEGSSRTLQVDSARWHSGRLLVRFAELPDRTAVEQARGDVGPKLGPRRSHGMLARFLPVTRATGA